MALYDPPVSINLENSWCNKIVENKNNENLKIWNFENKQHFWIDGFAERNKQWVVVLPSPFRNQNIFLGIKPSVIILPNNINKPLQIQSKKTQGKSTVSKEFSLKNNEEKINGDANTCYKRNINRQDNHKEYKREAYCELSPFKHNEFERYQIPQSYEYRDSISSIRLNEQWKFQEPKVWKNEERRYKGISHITNNNKSLRIRKPYNGSENLTKRNFDSVWDLVNNLHRISKNFQKILENIMKSLIFKNSRNKIEKESEFLRKYSFASPRDYLNLEPRR